MRTRAIVTCALLTSGCVFWHLGMDDAGGGGGGGPGAGGAGAGGAGAGGAGGSGGSGEGFPGVFDFVEQNGVVFAIVRKTTGGAVFIQAYDATDGTYLREDEVEGGLGKGPYALGSNVSTFSASGAAIAKDCNYVPTAIGCAEEVAPFIHLRVIEGQVLVRWDVQGVFVGDEPWWQTGSVGRERSALTPQWAALAGPNGIEMRPYDGTGPTVSPVAPGQSVIAIAASESATESAVAALLNTGVDMPSGTKKCTMGLLDSSLTLLGLDFDCEDARFALNESYLAMWHRDDHLFALARNAPAEPIELDSVIFHLGCCSSARRMSSSSPDSSAMKPPSKPG